MTPGTQVLSRSTAALLLMVLAACGQKTPSAATSPSAPTSKSAPTSRNASTSQSAPAAGAPATTVLTDPEKVVNVYSWAEYIAPDTIANFEKETGIKVRYATFDNNEMLETKLLTGNSGFDVVVPTGAFFERQVKAGVYLKLDRAQLPNWKNLDPEIMRRLAQHDPGNQHGVPYLWSTTGLGYNVDLIHARLGSETPVSWALLFDPKNAAKLKECGISIADSPVDAVLAAMFYLGRDPTKLDPKDVAAAGEVLRRIRPYVRYIDPAQYVTDLAAGDVCLSFGWSGDVVLARERAKEAGNGVKVAYFVPKEGTIVSLDMMGIPADAPHPHNAAVWLNYLLRADVMASITNYLKYPNGDAASWPLIDPKLFNDPSIFPTPDTRARLTTAMALPLDYSRLLNREWTSFRTGY